jgi:hypothetical protein
MPGTFLGESRRTSSNGTLKRFEMTAAPSAAAAPHCPPCNNYGQGRPGPRSILGGESLCGDGEERVGTSFTKPHF